MGTESSRLNQIAGGMFFSPSIGSESAFVEPIFVIGFRFFLVNRNPQEK